MQQTLKPAAVAEGRSSASPQPVPPTRPQPAQPGRPHPMGPRAAQPQAVQVAVPAVPAVPPVPAVPVPATHAVAQPTSPSGLENLGNQDAERRRPGSEMNIPRISKIKQLGCSSNLFFCCFMFTSSGPAATGSFGGSNQMLCPRAAIFIDLQIFMVTSASLFIASPSTSHIVFGFAGSRMRS